MNPPNISAFATQNASLTTTSSRQSNPRAIDNAVAESFFASLQCELLDRHTWSTRAGLAQAMFHWIEAYYNPTRRHSTLGYR